MTISEEHLRCQPWDWCPRIRRAGVDRAEERFPPAWHPCALTRRVTHGSWSTGT